MDKIAIIFGGSGYIGTHLLTFFLEHDVFDKYYILDIKNLNNFGAYIDAGTIEYLLQDVRNPIILEIDNFNNKDSWIFNFAAIHREPGHEYKEYFDTNIIGAENINKFASRVNIRNIFFTSSIAPYGKSLEMRNESSSLYPETAYGISKSICEMIHRNWLVKERSRRLVIVRPSVIYGPKDPGNIYRMIRSLKKGTFILPDGGKIIKSYGYIYGLIESIIFTMNKKESLIIYNYAENPLITLSQMVNVVKKELKIKKPTLYLPVWLLSFIASIIQIGCKLIGINSDIHPVRVRKAGFPTNIKPQYLLDNGFEFKYGFQKSLIHWKEVSPKDFD